MKLRIFLSVLLIFLIHHLHAQQNDSIQFVIDSTKSSEFNEIIQESDQRSIPIFKAPNYTDKRDVYTVDEVPHPKKNSAIGYISDPNDYLSASDEQKLNELIWQTEKKTTAQIAIVMLPSIGNEVPKNFAVDLFEKWGIGQADVDNGLLILTVMDQRRTEFEVGYGLEPILTDIVCFRIGTDEIVPHFKNGEFGQGMIAALKRIQQFLEDPKTINEIYSSSINHNNNDSNKSSWLFIPFLIYLLLMAILSIWKYGVAYDIERSKDDYYDKYQRLKEQKVGCLAFLFPIPLWFFGKMVQKRLKKYRYARRFSKINGRQLYLKDEWAENEFLEQAQILEEKLDSVRYDVWLTEDHSDMLILEYEGSSRKYTDCKECGYKTFGREKTVILLTATYNRSGKKLSHYNCRNCHFKEQIESIIPQRVKSSSSSSGSSFGGSSGSSGSFGGGSSGGGGAGVSW